MSILAQEPFISKGEKTKKSESLICCEPVHIQLVFVKQSIEFACTNCLLFYSTASSLGRVLSPSCETRSKCLLCCANTNMKSKFHIFLSRLLPTKACSNCKTLPAPLYKVVVGRTVVTSVLCYSAFHFFYVIQFCTTHLSTWMDMVPC